MVINFEQVLNYYERVVFEEVAARAGSYPDFTPDMLADAACVALNHLPSRYVRHDVDLIFYLTAQERRAIDHAMNEGLNIAFNFVAERAAKRNAAL
jgi:cell division septal protein FtsQ